VNGFGRSRSGNEPTVSDNRVRIGVLDLGSNSFHVCVADIDVLGQIVPVRHERIPVRLGRSVAHDGWVREKQARRIERIVRRLSKRMQRTEPDRSIAIATSALRDLDGRSPLTARIEAAADLPVRVLSGGEEAAYVFLAARSAFMLDGTALLSADLGGGSLDVALGDGALPTWTTSLLLGTAHLSATSLGRERGEIDDIEELGRHVHRILEPLAERVDVVEPDHYVVTGVTGGPVKAVAQLVQRASGDDRTLHGLALTYEDLRHAAEALAELGRDGRRRLAGLKERDVDGVLPAAIVLKALVDMLPTGKLTVSAWGLREGIMLETSG